MSQLLKFSISKFIAVTALVFATPLALANDVSWAISVGSPHPAPVYVSPPPAVYVQPQPVYVRPAPVYVQPAPVVQYGAPYYVEEIRYKEFKPHHWKHHHHYDRD